MSEHRLVRINEDLAEKISELYGISLGIAKRIVLYRKKHGYFTKPEDLAKVNKISMKLANTLAPHIDWRIPLIPEKPLRRNWLFGTIGIIAVIFFIKPLIVVDLPNFLTSFQEYQNKIISIYVLIADFSLVGIDLIGALGLFAFTVGSVITTPKFYRFIARFFWICAGLVGFCAFCMLVGGILQLCFAVTDEDWLNSWGGQPGFLSSGFLFLITIIIIAPNILVIWNPSLRSSYLLARTYDIATIIQPLVLVICLSVIESIPFLIKFLMGWMSGFWIFQSIRVITKGETFFDTYFLDPKTLRRISNRESWQKWVNSHLPNPKDQLELKQALENTYPRKIRTAIGAIVFAISSWLAIKILESVIEYIIVNFLDKNWPF